MSVRFILQFNETPSQALTTCTPWTRLLVEAGSHIHIISVSFSGREPCTCSGHVIGGEIALRKTINELNIITGIDVEQFEGDTTKAQRYLDASACWLHRAPFNVELLPVKLIAHRYKGSLVSVDGWNVTSLEIFGDGANERIPLEALGPLLDNLKELRLHSIPVSNFRPFRDLEILAVCDCFDVHDISLLEGCHHLKKLDVTWTRVENLSALAGAPSLEEIDASWSCVTTITGLSTCANLKKVYFGRCESLHDLSGLAGAPSLEVIEADSSGVRTITGLRMCAKLKKVNFVWCESLNDLSGLAGAPSLEVIEADSSGVTTIAGLGTCPNLKTVNFDECASLRDLSGLAGAPSLEVIQAGESGVTTITGLGSCPKLRHVNFTGCRMLHDLSPLESAPCLEKMEYDWGGITTGRALRTLTDTAWGCQENGDDTADREASSDDMHTDSNKSDSDTPEVGPLYTDPTALKFEVDNEGPIVALTPTVFRCNAPQDGTVYVPVPIGRAENAAIGVSVRFTGILNGYIGCGLFKKGALNAGDACEYLLGKTQHSIGCLLNNGEVFVFINDKPVFCGDTPENDELTMHFSFDRKKGMFVRIEKGVVNCDEFKDLSLFAGDLYFGISLSEEGQLARILPSGLGAPRFHYGMNSMDVDEDTQMNCKHSVRASLSAHERWYGNADKCFVMRITNVCREPIGIGLVSAKLWNNGRKNIVGGKAFGPHSIGLLLKDRRIYVHFQDEFIQWKPIGRMPPFPKTVDLMMRVRGGKVSFFYQGIPVNLPVIADLTLPADERFRAAYTMSNKGQAAVIPPNVPVGAPDNVTQRCSLLCDTANDEASDAHRSARADSLGALCFSSEAFAITPCAWDSYHQGCSGCECNAPSSDIRSGGTLWLCSKCGSPDEFALCDSCYWNENASKHDHDRNTFIPLFGAGLNEMRFVVEDAKDSYLEVGVAPASYKDGLGAFGKHTTTTVLLGKVSDLVKAAVPAEKIIVDCPELYNGSEVSIRVLGTRMTILVDRRTVFNTTLSAEDDPFMKQPLRFGVRMGSADQCIRLLRTTLVPNLEGATVAVTNDAEWLQRECEAVELDISECVAAGSTGTLVAVDAQTGVIDLNVSGRPALCPLACIEESHPSEEPGWPSAAQASAEQSSADQSSPFQPQTYPD